MQKIIHIKLELECNVHRAFEFFTANELLEKWLTEKADVQPHLGGKYELFWEPENKEINSTIGCKITGFEEDTFISFEWKGPVQFKSFMNTAEPLTHVIITFNNAVDNPNKTLVQLFHTGWRNDENWLEAYNFFDRAWNNALNKLKDVCERNNI
jgi:uncharacterized protein YndB with AHSA1/START domain